MSMMRFEVHDRESTPVGAIVRFSFYGGESEADLCYLGTMSMSASKFSVLVDQCRAEGSADVSIVDKPLLVKG